MKSLYNYITLHTILSTYMWMTGNNKEPNYVFLKRDCFTKSLSKLFGILLVFYLGDVLNWIL